MQQKSEKVALVVKKSWNCDNLIVDKCNYLVKKGIKCGMLHALCQYEDTFGITYENWNIFDNAPSGQKTSKKLRGVYKDIRRGFAADIRICIKK